METTSPSESRRSLGWRSPGLLLNIVAVVALMIVALESFIAFAVVFMEFGSVVGVLGGAAACGIGLMRRLGLRDEPRSLRWIVGSALGIGFGSLFILLLGALGWLTSIVAHALSFIAFVAGFVCVIFEFSGPAPTLTKPHTITAQHYAWLLICPFIAIVLLTTALPPGITWDEEARGYDVLEYHLAVPKTFFEQGQIAFLPNNVYSNFPMNYEMLALWMMARKGNAVEAAFMCQAVNVVLMLLFVGAAWQVGRMFSRQAGIATGVLAGTCGWISYLAGIAYVEVGMLAMGMAAMVALLQVSRDATHSKRWTLLAGLLAGLACGFKYTAVPMIALPLLAILLMEPKRWRLVGIYTIGMFITFSPWMIRNIVNTHNPVFPLATSVFGYADGAWDDVSAERFASGHGVSDDDQTVGVIWTALQRTIIDWRLGIVPLLFAAVGVLRQRDRLTWALIAILVIQVGVWLTMTHLFARFAVVLLLPLIVLAGRALEPDLPTWLRRGWLPVLLIAGTWNLVQMTTLYYHHTRIDGQPVQAFERIDWFVNSGPFGAINQLARESSAVNVMLVGEARSYYLLADCEYATVFNQHPMTAWLNETTDAAMIVERLRGNGTTHVLVDWSEIERFKRTYGFDERISPELFAALSEHGLQAIDNFANNQQIYATLYEVTDQ